jgi:hypothetical protein
MMMIMMMMIIIIIIIIIVGHKWSCRYQYVCKLCITYCVSSENASTFYFINNPFLRILN